jgi:hypothetical protein
MECGPPCRWSTCLYALSQLIACAGPVFTTSFDIMYNFEVEQQMWIAVYDVDTKLKGNAVQALDLKKQDFLGEVQFTLADLVRDQSKPHKLKIKKGTGELSVLVQEVAACKMFMRGTIRCAKVKNKGCVPVHERIRFCLHRAADLLASQIVMKRSCAHGEQSTSKVVNHGPMFLDDILRGPQTRMMQAVWCHGHSRSISEGLASGR